jgi:hypothetical protein
MEYCAYLLPAYSIGIWCFGLYGASRMGWSNLAQKYASTETYDGPWIGWQWAIFGFWGSYKGCIWIAINQDGIHLKTGPLNLFRPFHPPLYIPWSAIQSVKPKKYWLVNVLELDIKNINNKMLIKARFLEDIKGFIPEKITADNPFEN